MQPVSPPRRPAPILTDDNAFYWQAAAAGRLVAQRCGTCAMLRHPPRPMCPHCQSLAIDVIDLSGRGTLYSYAVLHHPQSPDFDYPVLAALVDLAEGIRLLSELSKEFSKESSKELGEVRDDIRIGMPLQVSFVATIGGYAVPVFQPVAPTGVLR